MAKNRTLYALFVIACLIFSVAYKSRISAVLLVTAIAYPLLALALTALSLLPVSVSFIEKRAVYEKQEQFELPISIRNNFIFPYAPIELDCLIPDNDTGLFLHKQIYVSVGPLKRMRIFVPCMHRYRGSYTAQIMCISVFDPLKLIRLTKRVDAATELVILPRRIPLQDLGMISCGEAGGLPEILRSGDKEDLSHVREYIEGDLVQLIHWKLTAKLDELMIKQYDATGDRYCVLLMDFGGSEHTAAAMIRRSDAVAETAIAVAMSVARSGVRLTADTGSLDGMSCDICDSAGSFEYFYDMISVMPPYIETIGMPELIRKWSAGETSAMFIVTPTVNEDTLAAAEAAASRNSGAVVLIYVNCSGNSLRYESSDSRFIFVEVLGETESALPAAAEQILEEYLTESS